MKKLISLLAIIALILSLTACGVSVVDSDSQEAEPQQEETNKEEQTENAPVELKLGETWEVDGEWKFTLTSAALTDERNEYEESKPEAVLYLKYEYENIGYKDEYGDDLFFSLDSLQDSAGNMCTTYPVNPEEIYPQDTPIGGKSTGSEAFGLVKAGSPCKLYLEKYDSKGATEHEAVYTIEF